MKTAKTRREFSKALQSKAMDVVFRTNDDGRIYGITFIDHENRVVLNGSRVGKAFSVNAFQSLFGENKTPVEEKRTKPKCSGSGTVISMNITMKPCLSKGNGRKNGRENGRKSPLFKMTRQARLSVFCQFQRKRLSQSQTYRQ